MSGAPAVELEFHVHWCPRHLEPLRDRWPLGAGVAMVRLLEAALADDRIADACPQTADGKPKAEALNAVLREFSPLCCLLGDDVAAAITTDAIAAGLELLERAKRGEIPPPPAPDGD